MKGLLVCDMQSLLYGSEIESGMRMWTTDSLHDLYTALRVHPPVLSLCLISTSLGRQLRLHGASVGNLLRSTDATRRKPGSALVVCSSRNRSGYEDELKDVRCCLDGYLRFKVTLTPVPYSASSRVIRQYDPIYPSLPPSQPSP